MWRTPSAIYLCMFDMILIGKILKIEDCTFSLVYLFMVFDILFVLIHASSYTYIARTSNLRMYFKIECYTVTPKNKITFD